MAISKISFAMTGATDLPPVISDLAEAFASMAVQVEAREFRLNEMLAELNEANRQLGEAHKLIASENAVLARSGSAASHRDRLLAPRQGSVRNRRDRLFPDAEEPSAGDAGRFKVKTDAGRLHRVMGVSQMTKIVSTHSYRGGTGKSNTTANIAATLGAARQARGDRRYRYSVAGHSRAVRCRSAGSAADLERLSLGTMPGRGDRRRRDLCDRRRGWPFRGQTAGSGDARPFEREGRRDRPRPQGRL